MTTSKLNYYELSHKMDSWEYYEEIISNPSSSLSWVKIGENIFNGKIGFLEKQSYGFISNIKDSTKSITYIYDNKMPGLIKNLKNSSYARLNLAGAYSEIDIKCLKSLSNFLLLATQNREINMYLASTKKNHFSANILMFSMLKPQGDYEFIKEIPLIVKKRF